MVKRGINSVFANGVRANRNASVAYRLLFLHRLRSHGATHGKDPRKNWLPEGHEPRA